MAVANAVVTREAATQGEPKGIGSPQSVLLNVNLVRASPVPCSGAPPMKAIEGVHLKSLQEDVERERERELPSMGMGTTILELLELKVRSG